MPYSFTSAAAVSSCVDSGFEAQSATWAPPALSVIMSTAVSVVTCRHAPSRTPFSGCSLVKRSRTCRSTGIDCSAHSILSLPAWASERSLTSCSVMLSSFHRFEADRPLDSGRFFGAGSLPP
jgi:hypothetical protein